MLEGNKGNFEHSREAAKITLDKVKSWEDLNAATMAEADEKFKEITKETWKDFAVSGTLQFDPKEGRQVLKPFTDLDGRCAVAILERAGVDTSNLTYVKPGEFLKGAINLDTGDRFGVVYEEPTYTAYFDHHGKGSEVTSTTEIIYRTMVDLGMMEKSPEMDRLVKFVNDIDNRKLPPEAFLKSGKTIIGVQRDLDFNKMLAYFSEHESPTDILTIEELERYGLKESAERQQKTVDESMAKLAEMEQEGKVIDTQYGKVVVNENNELRTGSSAAYVKYDGIINFSSGKSFAVTFKDKDLDEQALRQKLGDKFQGKIIRGKMWIYNGQEPLKLDLADIIEALCVGLTREKASSGFPDREFKERAFKNNNAVRISIILKYGSGKFTYAFVRRYIGTLNSQTEKELEEFGTLMWDVLVESDPLFSSDITFPEKTLEALMDLFKRNPFNDIDHPDWEAFSKSLEARKDDIANMRTMVLLNSEKSEEIIATLTDGFLFNFISNAYSKRLPVDKSLINLLPPDLQKQAQEDGEIGARVDKAFIDYLVSLPSVQEMEQRGYYREAEEIVAEKELKAANIREALLGAFSIQFRKFLKKYPDPRDWLRKLLVIPNDQNI